MSSIFLLTFVTVFFLIITSALLLKEGVGYMRWAPNGFLIWTTFSAFVSIGGMLFTASVADNFDIKNEKITYCSFLISSNHNSFIENDGKNCIYKTASGTIQDDTERVERFIELTLPKIEQFQYTPLTAIYITECYALMDANGYNERVKTKSYSDCIVRNKSGQTRDFTNDIKNLEISRNIYDSF